MKKITNRILKGVAKLSLSSAKHGANTACSGPIFEAKRPVALKKSK